jgi:hypothetical protein
MYQMLQKELRTILDPRNSPSEREGTFDRTKTDGAEWVGTLYVDVSTATSPDPSHGRRR